MAGACLLFDVRPHIAEGLARRLSARGVACLVLDSSRAGSGLSYAVSADGGLADLEIGGRPIDPATILGSYAELPAGPPERLDPRLPLTPEDFARDERRAALAALRALLPGCLNPPRDGALSGGFLPPAEQQARIRHEAPDLADAPDPGDCDATLAARRAGSGSDADRAAGGAICSCLFVGDRQHHFVWSERGPMPVDPGTAAFSRIAAAVARLARLFDIDAGEASYRFDGGFRFRALVPMFGRGDAYRFDACPAPLDDLAGRLCGER